MTQVSIANLDTIDKIKNDPTFRKTFLDNTEGFMKANGFSIDTTTLDAVIKKQLEGHSKLPAGAAARTAIIITIF